MRPILRRVLLGMAAVGVALLALGAVPSLLGSGDPYYVVATPTDDAGAAVNVSDLPERRFPYLTAAIADGRSSGGVLVEDGDRRYRIRVTRA
ncbi:MAG: hypothetical protein ABEJ78_04225 [Haloferacaceae archaeon]